MGPEVGGDELAVSGCAGEVGSGGWFDEIEGPKKEECRVGKVDGVCPCDELRSVGNAGWRKFGALAIFDDAIGGGGVAVPERPPALILFGQGVVCRWWSEKMAVIVASWCFGSGRLRQVDLDKREFGPQA